MAPKAPGSLVPPPLAGQETQYLPLQQKPTLRVGFLVLICSDLIAAITQAMALYLAGALLSFISVYLSFAFFAMVPAMYFVPEKIENYG